VHRGECFQVGLEGGRQAVVSRGQAGPQRVATGGGDDLRVQAGAQRRLFTPGDVGVPVAGGLGLVGCALDDLDLGVRFEPREEGLDLGHTAEGAGEAHVLFGCQVLVAEEDDLVARQCVAQFGLGGFVQRLAQVQAVDHGTDVRGVGLDLETRVGAGQVVELGHGELLDWVVAVEGTKGAVLFSVWVRPLAA